jgi:hypothetical protein
MILYSMLVSHGHMIRGLKPPAAKEAATFISQLLFQSVIFMGGTGPPLQCSKLVASF